MSIKFLSIPPKRLAQSIIDTSTTFKLTDILSWAGEDLVAADFGDHAWAVFRNENGTVMEIMEFDATTIADTSIDIVARGLSFDGSSDSSADRKLNWPAFETIVQIGTDAPQLFQELKDYIDGVAIAGSPDASLTDKGLVESATAAEITAGTSQGATGADLSVRPDQLASSKYGSQLPSADEKAGLLGLTAPSASNLVMTEQDLTGMVIPYAGKTAPAGYLLCDGSAVSRATYARLKTVICPSQTMTVTIASPGVVSATAHGLVAGDKVHLTTTGALPTGLAANTDYFVIAAGLTTDAFELALSPSGTVINTSGSQNGVHTVHKGPWGKGDGSTTFNIPDMRVRIPMGKAATAPTTTLSWEADARSGDNFAVPADFFPAQGQKVVLTSTGTLPSGLSLATNYWVIRNSSTSISFASSQANANAATPVKVTISDAGSGVHTMTYTHSTSTVIGKYGGEETHGISVAELAGHTHSTNALTDPASGGGGGGASKPNTTATNGSAGGDTQHNIMQPFAVMNYIIKT